MLAPDLSQAAKAEVRVSVDQARHSFGTRRVLRDVSIGIRAGEIYGLLGVNGAGKTTLMKAMCGQLRLDQGRVLVDGQDVSQTEAARRKVAFVPQHVAIYPHMTVRENLEVFGTFSGLRGANLQSAVADMLGKAGLEDRQHQLCSTLSGGYQRRVNICASMLHDPAVLILDEPTVGIDIDARSAIHALLDELRHQGAALLLTTHDFEQAQQVCDRIGVLDSGHVVLEGEPAQLIRHYFGDRKEIFITLAQAPDTHGDEALRARGFLPTQSPVSWLSWSSPQQLNVTSLSMWMQRNGLDAKEIRVRDPDISSLFLLILNQGVDT
jgi:ABC-2 type transport system ATP-binding protein